MAKILLFHGNDDGITVFRMPRIFQLCKTLDRKELESLPFFVVVFFFFLFCVVFFNFMLKTGCENRLYLVLSNAFVSSLIFTWLMMELPGIDLLYHRSQYHQFLFVIFSAFNIYLKKLDSALSLSWMPQSLCFG